MQGTLRKEQQYHSLSVEFQKHINLDEYPVAWRQEWDKVCTQNLLLVESHQAVELAEQSLQEQFENL